MWWVILEAAGGDPLRAQEIEMNLNEEWWWRYMADRDARAKAYAAKKESAEIKEMLAKKNGHSY